MEYLSLLHCQCRILRIELSRIPVRKLCTRICINLHIHTGVLLRQNVQRIDIHISVNQDYLFLRFPDDGCDQAERIVNLTIKEYLLLRFCVILNIPEYLVKLLIRIFLVG